MESSDAAANVKWKAFMCSNAYENDAAEQGVIMVSGESKDKETVCDECCQSPCNWKNYGPCLLKQMNNEYVGKFFVGHGTIVDEVGGPVRIGNKQLQFLAYYLFTAMKHGYLGKHNRKPIPKCIEIGIDQNYPDVNNVGFCTVEDV